MKHLWLMVSTSVLVLASVACVHPKGPSGMVPASAQRIFGEPFDRVWNTTLAVLTEDLSLPIQEVVPETGMISTKWVQYTRAPGDPQEANRRAAISGKPIVVEYKVVVLVKTSSEGTMVRARRYQREFRDKWYSVPTDLTFERQFLNMVATRLGVTTP